MPKESVEVFPVQGEEERAEDRGDGEKRETIRIDSGKIVRNTCPTKYTEEGTVGVEDAFSEAVVLCG